MTATAGTTPATALAISSAGTRAKRPEPSSRPSAPPPVDARAVDGERHSSADDETERLLHGVFLAYSVPCGVVKGSGGKDPMGRVASADAIDEIGWQKLCSDCKLDEDSSVPPALPIFKDVAQGEFLVYAGFLKVLKTVARVRYGDENLARLLYFKVSTGQVVRFCERGRP